MHTAVISRANRNVASTGGQLTTSAALPASNSATLLRKLFHVSDRAIFERADAGFDMIK